MDNNTEVIFENIEQRILKEIESAHYAIFVSVAWFTNKKLFNALLEKAKNNCYVSIIIQLDEINSQCGIDYTLIRVGCSECFMISRDAELLHEKFCVIDFRKVITGSYNWTYKAAHNSENILILNEPTIATQYISRFEQQKAKFQGERIQQHTVISYDFGKIKEITQSSPPISSTPTNKECPYLGCRKIIGYYDRFCPFCGRQQYNNYNSSIIVTCEECSCKQEEVLVDATRTQYCTNCGSNKLEWKLI